uniref:Transcription initiation factor TFIID subunit 8 n=1 Tax=Steinernema glaseri TaxID=37863 RepID=A0A1I7YBN4_9BILA
MERSILEQNQELADKMNRAAPGVIYVATSSELNPVLPIFPRLPGQEKVHTTIMDPKEPDIRNSGANEGAKQK